MTIHSAKGLEFPFTYIVGLEENLLPFYLIEDQDDLEEERRLFYVAITRAKQSLTLSLAQRRYVFGSYNVSKPSPFLQEIDPSVLEFTVSSFSAKNNFSQKPPYPSQNATSFPAHKQPIYQQQIYIKPTSISNTPIEAETNLQLGNIITQSSQLALGMRVFHSKFGMGTIKDIIADENKTIICFDSFGDKTILINYAKLRPAL
jgi:DNA helicase-2/ATP-dependent DNA helicase PcrA